MYLLERSRRSGTRSRNSFENRIIGQNFGTGNYLADNPPTPLVLSSETPTLGFSEPLFEGLFQRIKELVMLGKETIALRLAISQGLKDENELSNLIFFARHEKRRGKPIERHEKTLAREWLNIRDRLVRPALSGPMVKIVPAPPVQPSIPAASWKAFKSKAVGLANQEWIDWGRGSKQETDRDRINILRNYYTEAGLDRSTDRLLDPVWHANHPWSAVFISWLMWMAGAGSKFRYSRGHKYYIAAAKRNRIKNRFDNPFWAFRVDEVVPEPGDLVCAWRTPKKGRPRATYGNIDEPDFKPTHCDIVTEVHPNRIVVIGGNAWDQITKMHNTVGRKSIRTNDQGKISPEEQRRKRLFAIIKVRTDLESEIA